MDGLWELLAHLDWLERLDEGLHWLLGISSWRFSVPRQSGWSGEQIEGLLQQHGIKIWGRAFNREQLFFRVKEQQANWAEYLLWQHGVPVSSRPFNQKNRLYGQSVYKQTEHQEPSNKRSSWLESLLALFL